jgi:hypothetical protein
MEDHKGRSMELSIVLVSAVAPEASMAPATRVQPYANAAPLARNITGEKADHQRFHSFRDVLRSSSRIDG